MRSVVLFPRTAAGVTWRILLVVLFALAIDAFWFEPSSIRLIKHEINVTSAKELRGLRIAVIADLHTGAPYIGEAKLRRIVHLVSSAKPDLILLAGDYVVEGVIGGKTMPIETTAALLQPLRAPMGVYAVLGNHDHWDDENKIARALRSVGIKVVENESVRLKGHNHEFSLVGIGDRMTFHDNIARAFRAVPKDARALCLTHSPDVFPDLPKTCLLTIAGHTHGGQVALPFTGRLIVPSKFGQRYAAGLIQENGKYMFISTGIGTSIIPVRFGVPPEISLIEIR